MLISWEKDIIFLVFQDCIPHQHCLYNQMPDFQTYHMSYFDETKTGLSNLSQLSFDLTKSSFQLNREYSFGAIFSGLKYQYHAI